MIFIHFHLLVILTGKHIQMFHLVYIKFYYSHIQRVMHQENILIYLNLFLPEEKNKIKNIFVVDIFI